MFSHCSQFFLFWHAKLRKRGIVPALFLIHNAQDNLYCETKTTFLPSMPAGSSHWMTKTFSKEHLEGSAGSVWEWPGGHRNPSKLSSPCVILPHLLFRGTLEFQAALKVTGGKGTSIPKARKVILIPLTVSTLCSGPKGTFISFFSSIYELQREMQWQ